MADARGQTVSVRIAGDASDGRVAEFAAAGTVITFRGFLLAYEEGRDEAVARDDEERLLPKLAEGDALDARPRSSRTGTRRARPPATPTRRS